METLLTTSRFANAQNKRAERLRHPTAQPIAEFLARNAYFDVSLCFGDGFGIVAIVLVGSSRMASRTVAG